MQRALLLSHIPRQVRFLILFATQVQTTLLSGSEDTFMGSVDTAADFVWITYYTTEGALKRRKRILSSEPSLTSFQNSIIFCASQEGHSGGIWPKFLVSLLLWMYNSFSSIIRSLLVLVRKTEFPKETSQRLFLPVFWKTCLSLICDFWNGLYNFQQ